MSCKHENFSADVAINRLAEVEGGAIGTYNLEVRVHCTQCSMPFRFICPTVGILFDRPCISVDALELRAPIHPNDGTTPLPPKIKGYTVTAVMPHPGSAS